jgi:hypothetical protein
MANPYKAIWDHNGNDKDRFTLPDNLQQEDCPGLRIMARATQIAAGNAVTFRNLFDAFMEQQFRVNWVWQPNAGGSNNHGLLDGSKLSGECLHFARNLWFLSRVPAPWGLGLDRDQIRTSEYKGATNNGFASRHPGVFLQLRANVAGLPGYAGPALYVWENHKTVLYQGTYYDACYGVTYNNEADMAAYQGTDRTVRTDMAGLYDVAKDPGWQIRNGGKTAEKFTSNGRIFYFRVPGLTENLGAGVKYQGPIDETRLELMRQNAQGLRIVR